ncbi:unnamed protein product [Peronospora destructor]|uniref:DH domain-containing protein n=1 Tax=Peronospora destructor TaxID=86335 RepID=A0AAV0V9F4_9STRA|nr:unnamed protein product [Peronospora destructor]
MPMERILRYKMLLQELLGSTPPEHVDLVPLQSAIQSVDRVANKIEEISEMREKSRDFFDFLDVVTEQNPDFITKYENVSITYEGRAIPAFKISTTSPPVPLAVLVLSRE